MQKKLNQWSEEKKSDFKEIMQDDSGSYARHVSLHLGQQRAQFSLEISKSDKNYRFIIRQNASESNCDSTMSVVLVRNK